MQETVFRLYHHPLDAASRRVRLTLGEKNIACQFAIEKPWDPSADFSCLSPTGDVPVLTLEQNGARSVFMDATAICEYLDETQGGPNLLGNNPIARAETRRLTAWFDNKFYHEVTYYLTYEKIIKQVTGGGEPNSQAIHSALHNMRGHLQYIEWLFEQRKWLAGDDLSFADLAAAAQLSVLDYLDTVPWYKFPIAKEWYAKIKSRPSFRPLLTDHIASLIPPRHYADVDF